MEEGLARRLEDLAELCRKRGRITCSDFVKPEQLPKISARHVLSGGFEGAERVAVFFLPDPVKEGDFRAADYLSAARIKPRDGESYTHRDYLGAVTALGISRDKLGDLIVEERSAVLLGFTPAVRYVAERLETVSRTTAVCNLLDLSEVKPREKRVEEFTASLTSLRADCAVAQLFAMSRARAVESVNCGLVIVDGEILSKPDRVLPESCLLAVRGKGRVRLLGISGRSQKGKLRVRCGREQ